ncbi:hypothetical protein LRS03_08990 [Rhizobacter sp. J219]|uniref:hypothetical protein n=1 Tax=Rhizobacter sp. J219 TaxID=2898430 RepID=UPI002150CBFF|nr:hypothetical protein [Rhizobacter sp. J219]MCR5882984.1 hypothetical protein [Rhizobacter sp. J219]
MSNKESLLAGPAARTRGLEKVQRALALIYMTHVVSRQALATLLDIDLDNASHLLARMVANGLVQVVELKATSALRERIVWMLTPKGVVEATRHPEVVVHPYPKSPSSLESGHLDHDAEVARTAARFMAKGAALVGTHYTLREGQKGKKVVDALLNFEGQEFAIEYERTKKSDQELQDALLAAIQLNIVVFWICARQEIRNSIGELLADSTWPLWSKEPGKKWEKTGVRYVSPWLTSKHFLVMDDKSTTGLPPSELLHIARETRDAELHEATLKLMDDGWDSGNVNLYDSDEGRRWSFNLSYRGRAGLFSFEVFSQDGKKWALRYDDHFMRGDRRAALPYWRTAALGARPTGDLIHAAVWTAEHYNYLQG